MVFSVAKFKSRTPLMYDSHSGEISYYTYRCAYILSNYLYVFFIPLISAIMTPVVYKDIVYVV